MKKFYLFIILIFGLFFTSLIKNQTREVEKKIKIIDKEINYLDLKLSEASIEFEYLSSPERIMNIIPDYLEDNFSFYNNNQINILNYKNLFEEKGFKQITKNFEKN